MARPRRKAKIQISLFPFLDVLSGVIGVLSLVIIGTVIGSVQSAVQSIELVEGQEQEKQATFIECRSDSLIIYRVDEDVDPVVVPIDQLESPKSAWQELLQKIAAEGRRRHLVFLIRPQGSDGASGVACFERARRMAKSEFIDVGYEPVYDAGPIVFEHSEPAAVEEAAADTPQVDPLPAEANDPTSDESPRMQTP